MLKTYKYDSFGNIINPPTVGDPNDPLYVDQSPFGYAGEYLDKENGEIYLRARYYNSAKGRFVTEAPIQYGTNWYSYCENNPVTQIDRTGLEPTTDGSLNADKYANDYMIATYYNQQASVHPEMTQPAPEPPKTTHGKWSKNTFKTVLPINFRYYNVDRTEFQSPFEYADKYGNIIESPSSNEAQNNNETVNFISAMFSNYSVDKMSESATLYWSNSIVRHSILESSKAIDDILRFTPVVGVAMDASLRIIEGEEIHHAVNKSVLVTLSVAAIIPAVVAMFGTITPLIMLLSLMISVLFDIAISSLYDKVFKQ